MTETLDISGGVTEEQYREVLRLLLEQFENWRRERSWCTDIYLTVSPLTRSFHWDPYASGFYQGYDGHMEIDVAFHTDESRGQDLRDIRGRILKYVNDRTDVFDLDKANEFLRNSGLPVFTPATPATPAMHQFYVDLTGIVNTEMTEDEMRKKFARWMKRNGFSGERIYAENQTPRTPRTSNRVPDSEIVNLIPGVGRPTARP